MKYLMFHYLCKYRWSSFHM